MNILKRSLLLSHLPLAILAACPASAQQLPVPVDRIALIITDYNYTTPLVKLDGPPADGKNLAKVLPTIGFHLFGNIVQENKTQAQITDLLSQFKAQITTLRAQNHVVITFVYYSGHGASFQTGTPAEQNYLVPVRDPHKSALTSADQLPLYGVQLDTVVKYLKDSKANISFLIFDACRKSISLQGEAGDISKWKWHDRIPGMDIAFSTDENALAQDAPPLYSTILADALTKDETSANLFHHMQARVGKNSYQQPYDSDGIDAMDFYFAGPNSGINGGIVPAKLDATPQPLGIQKGISLPDTRSVSAAEV